MMSCKKISLILIFLSLFLSLFAQYNERDILTQQAFQLLGQRKFAEAEQVFLQILDKYPNDSNSVIQLLNIYFQTSQMDKAENLLRQYRRILPANQATEQEILLLIMQGKPDEAKQKSDAYLLSQNYNQNICRLLASYFERRGFYEYSLQIYQEARRRKNDPELFRLEIANAALNASLFDLALSEYLAFLDKNPANIFFITNQCKIILNQNPECISTISDYAESSANPVIKELYANILVSQKQYLTALEVYKSLPQDRLVNFAEQQYNAGNDEIALLAFQYLQSVISDPFIKNSYRLREALVHYRNGRYEATQETLNYILADSLMTERPYIYRQSVNMNARKLMAETTLALEHNPQKAEYWYKEAKKFCANAYEIQNIDLALARLKLTQEDYPSALKILNSIQEPILRETRDYLLFNLELLQGNIEVADSLMNNFVIHFPQSPYVNDAVYQMMFVLGLDKTQQQQFFIATRLMMLQNPACVDTLLAIFENTQDEEILILAAEWSILLNQSEKAKTILEHSWQDPICNEYAELLKLSLTEDGEQMQRMAREFLKSNPGSIFAPKFRQYITRQELRPLQF